MMYEFSFFCVQQSTQFHADLAPLDQSAAVVGGTGKGEVDEWRATDVTEEKKKTLSMFGMC